MTEHPADTWDRQQIATAIGYAILFMRGPQNRIRETAATYAEAQAIKERLDAEHGAAGGRRAMIYALLPDGSALPVGQPYETAAMRADRLKRKERTP